MLLQKALRPPRQRKEKQKFHINSNRLWEEFISTTRKLRELLTKIPNKTILLFWDQFFKFYCYECGIYSAFVKYVTLPLTSLGLVNVNIPACPDRSRPLASHTGPQRMSSLWSSRKGHNLRPKKKITYVLLVCNFKCNIY